MMMSSVPLHWDPVQFQKQIQPFIFQIIVAVYQLLPVFYLSLRLMWSFSQTAFCANSIVEHTCRTACLRACLRMCTCEHGLGFANEQTRVALVHYKTPILLETIIHLVLSFFPYFVLLYLFMNPFHRDTVCLISIFMLVPSIPICSQSVFACRVINPQLLCVMCCAHDECVMLCAYRIINSPWVGVWYEMLS